MIGSKTLADFVLDYNHFIWNSIKQSHGNVCPQIQANRRGNYHENVSSVDKYLYYLYFQKSFVKKFIASVLSSAYRNPKKVQQKGVFV